MKKPLTDQMLLEQAAAKGARVTRDQVERWRKQGLLPRSVQQHVRGRRGSLSLCPPESALQLVALHRLHQKERRLDELRFLLWWERYAVDRKKLRGYLCRAIQRITEAIGTAFDTAKREARKEECDPEFLPLATAEQIAKALSGRNSRSPLVRFVRRNLRRDKADLYSFFITVFQTATGSTPAFGSDGLEGASLESIVFRGAGMEQIAPPGIGGALPLVPEGAASVPDIFEKIGAWRVFDFNEWARVVETASDEDLDRARDWARLLVEDLPVFVDGYEPLFGKNLMGLGGLRYLRGIPKPFFLPLLLIVSKRLGAEAIDPIRDAVHTWRPQAEAFIAVFKIFPQYKKYFTPDITQKLALLPEDERTKIINEVGGYLKAHHPEIMTTAGIT